MADQADWASYRTAAVVVLLVLANDLASSSSTENRDSPPGVMTTLPRTGPYFVSTVWEALVSLCRSTPVASDADRRRVLENDRFEQSDA